MRNPYAASATRHTEIQHTEWPPVTASLLQDHERLAATHDPSQINQPIFALVRARKALMDAILACRFAAKQWEAKPEVRDRLLSIASEVRLSHSRFPLSIIGQSLSGPAKAPVPDSGGVHDGNAKGYRAVEE